MVTPSRTTDGIRWKPNSRLGLLGVSLFGCAVVAVLWNKLHFISSASHNDFTHTRGAQTMPRSNNFIYKLHTDSKLDPTDCSQLLNKYRSGKIPQTNKASEAYPIDKSYITRSNTDQSFSISVHDARIDQMRHDIFKQGIYYESIMTNVIADMFSETKNMHHKVMIDVGANVGWFSLLAASYGAEVFAFEPNVINVVRFCESQLLNGWSLAENLEANNRIHTYLKGVGSEHGQVLQMYTPDPKNPGSYTFNQGLAKDHFAKRKAAGDLQQLDEGGLPIVTLDALAKDQGWLSKNNDVKIVLMKMDIEGHEPMALRGSKELLRANIIENILMEFNADSPRSDWVELANTLLECGYKVYKIGDHRGPDVDFQSASENPDTIIDEIKGKPFSSHGNVNVWFKVKS